MRSAHLSFIGRRILNIGGENKEFHRMDAHIAWADKMVHLYSDQSNIVDF